MKRTSWLRTWTSPLFGRRRSPTSLARRQAAPGVERLERRDLMAAGALDPTFGVGGTVLTDLGSDTDLLTTVAVQADGKVVAGGSSGGDVALVRYNADGTLDATFGDGGKVLTDLGSDDLARALALQADGKIVVAAGNRKGAGDPVLLRFSADGALDPTFGVDGLVGVPGDGAALAVAVGADGKIVAAGRAGGDFVVVRFDTDGLLDTAFGGGVVIIDFGGLDEARALVLEPDGSLVVAGEAEVASPDPEPRIIIGPRETDFALVRLNADGTLDASFGEGGKVLTDFAGRVEGVVSVALAADGKLVAAGRSDGDVAVARYNPDGTLDAGFDAEGKVLVDLGGDLDSATGVVVQPDGRVLATAGSPDLATSASDFVLLRLDADGTFDDTFGTAGVVRTDLGGFDQAAALALEQGRVVVAGLSQIDRNSDLALARYLLDIEPPKVESVVVNDGSRQRSKVTSLTVTFSEEVTLDPDAFVLRRDGGGLVELRVALSVVDGKTVAVLTFRGDGIVGGSLADGNYTLTVRSNRVHDGAGLALDGDGDGVAGDNARATFFRLFGDSDGDRDVDVRDLVTFAGSLGSREGSPRYRAFLDFNDDGDIDLADALQFFRRLGDRLSV